MLEETVMKLLLIFKSPEIISGFVAVTKESQLKA